MLNSAKGRFREGVKTALRRVPSVGRPLWKAYYQIFPKEVQYLRAETGDDREQAFEEIFHANEWKSSKSRSGSGSTLATTKNIRRELPPLIKKLSVETILDAPCGDFNWMKFVEFPEQVKYIGGDIVQELIDDLASRFAKPGYGFIRMDFVEDPLPEADLWLCRHALFHLPNSDINTILAKFADSKINYLLTTNHDFCRVNHDVNAGGFRYINLMRKPFNLPKPRMKIDDNEMIGPPSVLALWSREEVAAALAVEGKK